MAQQQPQRPGKPPNERTQLFEVVLLKKGGAAHAAVPEDFRRVPVEATSSIGAMYDDKVDAAMLEAPGWTRLGFAALPGQLTEPESQARARAHSSSFQVVIVRVK